jgi:hypothetical protein
MRQGNHSPVELAAWSVRAVLVVLTMSIAAATAVHAQAGPPTGWRWILDGPAGAPGTEGATDTTWSFVAMPPGWHVTMGPGGILFDPSRSAADRFVIESEMFLFPSSGNEGYGVFAGGTGLDQSESGSYVAFVLRADGHAGIFAVANGRSRPVREWSAAPAILRSSRDGPVRNVLRVEADRDEVRFLVNGEVVASSPRSDLQLDGVFGLRFGTGANSHVTTLDVTQRYAPPPASSR